VQQNSKQGNIILLLLILIAVVAVVLLFLFKSGKLDSLLNKQKAPSVSTQSSKADELGKGDEIGDIEKDLNSTNLSETDKVLGEIDVALTTP